MEFWNDLVNSAMIGTDRKQPAAGTLPNDVAEQLETLQTNAGIDKEERFLQTAAIAFNYRQSGFIPAINTDVDLDAAPAEDKRYCNAEARQCLKDILSEESMPLLQIWLEHCIGAGQIVNAAMVPALLFVATQHKKLQSFVHSCCGRRGEWLAKFNPQWNFSSGDTAEQVWQTGTMEMRKNIFLETRKSNPSQALEWLQQTWKEEDANAKAAFLDLMTVGLQESDLPFLESLASEKSKKVKEAAVQLLRSIPSSAIVLRYERALSERVHLKKEKALLGLVNKAVLQFEFTPLDEGLHQTGIEKLSNKKEMSDSEYVLFQLIASVPTSFWEKQLQCTPQETLQHFQKNDTGKKMLPALVNATVRFSDRQFAIFLMQYSEVFYIDILPLLPSQQQEHYSVKFFKGHEESVLSYALQFTKEWSIELARLIFEYASQNPYQYSKSFFNTHIQKIPPAIIPELEKFVPKEEYYKTMWSNTCEYLAKLVQLKQQTIKAFKA